MWYFIINRNEIQRYRQYQPWTLLDFDQSEGSSLLHKQHTVQWQRDVLNNKLVTGMVMSCNNKTNETTCVITSYLEEVRHIFSVAKRNLKDPASTYIVGYMKDKTMKTKEFKHPIEANDAFLKIKNAKLPAICIEKRGGCFDSIKLYGMNLQRNLDHFYNEKIGIRVDLDEDDPYYGTDVFIVRLKDANGNTISVSCQIDFIHLRY